MLSSDVIKCHQMSGFGSKRLCDDVSIYISLQIARKLNLRLEVPGFRACTSNHRRMRVKHVYVVKTFKLSRKETV
jgi:hypothetical protein